MTESEGPQQPWVLRATARAPSNIAVIKYWGKRDERLVLPLNSSLSVTLDPADLSATTTAAASPAYASDRLWLNGKEVPLDSARYQAIFGAMRARAAGGVRVPGSTGRVLTGDDLRALKLHVASQNNFPTAAGLASSAAGFACLVYCLAKLLNVTESYPGELTALARQGSGSACRSLFSGFVRWNAGTEDDGRDSIAEQVAPAAHWPELRVLIAVVSSKQKETSSTSGMQDSVRTSALIRHRATEVVPRRMREMEAAIRARDFRAFARLTCADSNQFHAVCLDTAPPIFYLTDTSRQVIALVERWNGANSEPMAAYTFDAGPNAVLFMTEAHAPELLRRLLYHFPPPPGASLSSYVVGGTSVLDEAGVRDLTDVASLSAPPEAGTALRRAGELQYIISTRPGEGAHYLEDSHVPIPHTPS